MLMVSYCDRSSPASVVRHASSTIALNDISSETVRPILIKLHINNLLDGPLSKLLK